MTVVAHDELLTAMRTVGGRATLSDLATATGYRPDQIQSEILPAIAKVDGHVAVDDNGELIYRIDTKRTAPTQDDTRWAAFRRSVYALFQFGYSAGMTIILIAYFVVLVVAIIALAVAAIAAASRGSDTDCDCDRGDSNCAGCGRCVIVSDGGCNGCGDAIYGCFTCGSSKRKAERQVLRGKQKAQRQQKKKAREARRQAKRARRLTALTAARERLGLTSDAIYLGFGLVRDEAAEKPPLSTAVKEFVFGPPETPPMPRARERNFLAFAQAHRGRVTASDAVSLTGLSLDEADAVLVQLAARFEGDIEVTDNGVIVYTFDRLLISATESTDVLSWIQTQGGSVSVSTFAERHGITAAQALVRLQHLAELVGGRAEHEAETRFVFPDGARFKLRDLQESADALRDYTYCWDRLEVSPARQGAPGHRKWIIGLNVFNLVASLFLMASVGSLPLEELNSTGALVGLGVVPFTFSLLCFVIPLTRGVVENIRDRGRLRRNAHRVMLLAVFHRMEEDDPIVDANELMTTLRIPADLPAVRAQVNTMLDALVVSLHGDLDSELGQNPTGGFYYRFQRVHEELHTAEHVRLEVDVDGLGLAEIIYDSADATIGG